MDEKKAGQQAEEPIDEVFPVDEAKAEQPEKPKLVTSIASTVDEAGDAGYADGEFVAARQPTARCG